MSTITHYTIAGAKDMPSLVAEVQRMISEERAQPLGGVATCVVEEDGELVQHFVQAMVLAKSDIFHEQQGFRGGLNG